MTTAYTNVLTQIDDIKSNPKYIKLKNKNRTKHEIQIYDRMKRDLIRLNAELSKLDKTVSPADRQKAIRDATANPKPRHRAPPKKPVKIKKKPNWRNQRKKVAWRNQIDANSARNDDARDAKKESEYAVLFRDYELSNKNKPIRKGGPVPQVRKPRMPTITQEELDVKVAIRLAAKRARARTLKIMRQKKLEAAKTTVRKPKPKREVIVISKIKPDPSASFTISRTTQPKKSSFKRVDHKRSSNLPITTRKPRPRIAKSTGIPKRRTVPKPHPLEVRIAEQKESVETDLEDNMVGTDDNSVAQNQRRRMPRPQIASIVKRPQPKLRRPPPMSVPDDEPSQNSEFDSFEDDLDNFEDDGSLEGSGIDDLDEV